jgi:N-terminal domain of anti-restriction factor ArdC
MTRKRATPGQIARAKAHRAELKAKVDAFLARNHGEVFVYAKLNGGTYSDRNGAMLAMQAEERGMTVTAFASYDDWKAAGRQVRKHETAFRVLAPRGQRDVKTDPDDDDSPTKTRKFFRDAPTFAYEQTDPIADLNPEAAA